MNRLARIKGDVRRAINGETRWVCGCSSDIPYLLDLIERCREAMKLCRTELEIDARHGCKDAQKAIDVIDSILKEITE